MAGVSNDVVLPIEVFAAEQCLPALAINVKIDQISQPKPLWRVPRGEIDDEGGNDRDADEEGKELVPAEFFHLSNSIQLHKLRKSMSTLKRLRQDHDGYYVVRALLL